MRNESTAAETDAHQNFTVRADWFVKVAGNGPIAASLRSPVSQSSPCLGKGTDRWKTSARNGPMPRVWSRQRGPRTMS